MDDVARAFSFFIRFLAIERYELEYNTISVLWPVVCFPFRVRVFRSVFRLALPIGFIVERNWPRMADNVLMGRMGNYEAKCARARARALANADHTVVP